MPLVYVHGVANRSSAASKAEAVQRATLFKSLVFRQPDTLILEPKWGENAAAFSEGMPWIPDSEKMETFSAGRLRDSTDLDLGLGRIAKIDAAQAIDLPIVGLLEDAILRAAQAEDPSLAMDPDLLELATAAARYSQRVVSTADSPPTGLSELVAETDFEFADALQMELEGFASSSSEAYGIGGRMSGAMKALADRVTNGVSDLALRKRRRSASSTASLFLGDIFVYLRGRDLDGPTGTHERIFEPILRDLIEAARAPRHEGEPLLVVGHSLGGVILYDLLTDSRCLERLRTEAPELRIDLLATVGSQPGFFADMQLYEGKPRGDSGRLAMPPPVAAWVNVYDYTDAFSFLCEPFFDGVRDFGYDTKVDLLRAHSSYFQRPSFYIRLEARLKELGTG